MSRPLDPLAMLLAAVLDEIAPEPSATVPHRHRCGFEPMREHRLRDRWFVRYRNNGGCGFVWEHLRPAPGEDYSAAHRCPQCGLETRWIYEGRHRAGTGKLPEVTRGLSQQRAP